MYKTKYLVEFKTIENKEVHIYLMKKGYEGAITDVIASSGSPLIMEFLDSNIFDPIKGGGAKLRLISSTDRQLIDLYTANYKEWKAEIYVDSVLMMCGYVESEMYSEPFDRTDKYEVSVTINNGIGIFNRELYLDNNGNKYKGITTAYDVIVNCINRLQIDEIIDIHVISDLTINNHKIPYNKSILNYIKINNDNYIDEDGVVMNCKDVLISVLQPLNLSLLAHGQAIYIADFSILKTNNIVGKWYHRNFGENFTNICSNKNHIFHKNLNEIQQITSEYDVSAGYNNLTISKNKYVKNIIEKVELDKNITGGEDNIVEKINHKIFLNPRVTPSIRKEYWMRTVDGFENFEINNIDNLPNSDTEYNDYFQNLKVASAINYKEVTVLKNSNGNNVELNWDNDDKKFNTYIRINNPLKGIAKSDLVKKANPNELVLPINPLNQNINDIAILSAKYTKESPIIFNSENTLIKLNLSVHIPCYMLHLAMTSRKSGIWANNVFLPEDEKNRYAYFFYYTKIKFVDKNNNTKYIVRMKNSENLTATSIMPDPYNIQYETVRYTEGMFDWCIIPIHNIDKAGNETSILNKDTTASIMIPVNFDKNYRMVFELYNIWYGITKNGISGHIYYDGNNIMSYNDDEYRILADFKESFPFILIKDVNTQLVDVITEEAIDLSDEEIKYSLSDIYRTEEENIEIKHQTGDNIVITNAGAILYDNDDYIFKVNNSEFNKENIEDMLAEKIMKQYKENRINLSMNVVDYLPNPLYTYYLPNDIFWNNKKWVINSYEYDIVYNYLNLKLIEKI